MSISKKKNRNGPIELLIGSVTTRAFKTKKIDTQQTVTLT
jgi:hypothetical protein